MPDAIRTRPKTTMPSQSAIAHVITQSGAAGTAATRVGNQNGSGSAGIVSETRARASGCTSGSSSTAPSANHQIACRVAALSRRIRPSAMAVAQTTTMPCHTHSATRVTDASSPCA